jgi:hypothetical protein
VSFRQVQISNAGRLELFQEALRGGAEALEARAVLGLHPVGFSRQLDDHLVTRAALMSGLNRPAPGASAVVGRQREDPVGVGIRGSIGTTSVGATVAVKSVGSYSTGTRGGRVRKSQRMRRPFASKNSKWLDQPAANQRTSSGAPGR